MKKREQIEPEYDKPKVRISVEEGFESIFGCDENSSLEQRFDSLLHIMTANAFYIMDRQRSTGKKIGDAEREFQEECMAQLRLIDKCFTMARKNGRTSGKHNENFDAELLIQIRNRKGSIADIVQNLPPISK